MTDTSSNDRRADTTEDGVLSPGSTATGGGTTEPDIDPLEVGTTEGDVSDGREQKLPPHDDNPSVS